MELRFLRLWVRKFLNFGRRLLVMFLHKNTSAKRVWRQLLKKWKKTLFLAGYGAAFLMKWLWHNCLKKKDILAKLPQNKFLTASRVLGSIGGGKVVILTPRKTLKSFTTKCVLCSLHKWQHRLPRSGLTLVCTGLMALMVLAKDIILLIPKAKKSLVQKAPTNAHNRTLASFKAFPMTL